MAEPRMNAASRAELIALIVRVVREEVPVRYDRDLCITNHSGRAYVCMDIRVGEKCLLYVNTRGAEFDIAAGSKVQPYRGARGVLFIDKIETALRTEVRKRLPRVLDHLELNRPLEGVRGVKASRDHDEKTITLEFKGLSDEAYLRIVEVLEPLMASTRFMREPPV